MCEGTDSRCTTASSKPRDPLQNWRCEPLSLPTFFAAAKKVGAAPHRGNANRPLSQQGKANKSRTKPNQPNQTPKQKPAPPGAESQKQEIARINPSFRPIAPQANQQQSPSPALTASNRKPHGIHDRKPASRAR